MSNGRSGPDGDAPRGVAKRAPGSVQSVDRALRVLEILADHGARGVTEIADELGVHKSTAFRLISVLEDHQLVEQVEDRRPLPPRFRDRPARGRHLGAA